MRFCDLGSVTVERAGAAVPLGGKKPTAILAILLSSANRRVSVEVLTTSIWGDDAAERAVPTLESHIWRLRRVLEPDRGPREPAAVLVNDSGGYRLVAPVEDVDSLRFARLAEEVRDLVAAGHGERALRRSDEALALWRGRPYGGLADEPWAQAPAARLEEIHAQVQEHRIDAQLAAGRLDAALSDLEPLVTQMPFRERLWGQRMTGLYRAGRAEEALQTFQRVRGLLLEEVGLEPGAELRDLQRRILEDDPALAGRVPAPRQPPPRPAAVHLPGRMSALIGRSGDVAGVAGLLARSPLVTIVGAAGCGKTRLSIDVARAAAPGFPDGVWFVDLSAVEDPALVADIVNSAIGLAPPAVGSSLDALRAYTRDRRMLLILDNCEHLLAAVAGIVESILGNDSACHVLATSRETIGVDGEVVWSLRPLALVGDGGGGGGAGAGEPPALALFRARLLAADPTLVLGADQLAVAAGICAAVDGLPLAIELAAARIRSSTLEEIADQVSADVGALARIGRGPSDHRETLRAAIERSHRLLDPAEQAVHRRLAVLPGGFTRDAAAAVAAAEGDLTADEVSDLLASLVNRSMLTSVRSTRPGGPSIFAQLATVRSHALHALRSAGEETAAIERRNEWVRALFRSRPRISHPDEGWCALADDSMATIRATLQSTLASSPSPLAWSILSRTQSFWYYRGRLMEASRWFALAEQLPVPAGADPVEVALMRLNLASNYGMRGRSDLMQPILDAVLPALAQGPADALPVIADALCSIAFSAVLREQYPLAQMLAAALQQIADRARTDDTAILAEAVAVIAALRDDPIDDLADRAERVHDRALAHGLPMAAILATQIRTSIALRRRDAEDGILWSKRAIALQLELGARPEAILLENRANFTFLSGDLPRAARLFAASRAQSRRAGTSWPFQAITSELFASLRASLSAEDLEQARVDGESMGPVDLMY